MPVLFTQDVRYACGDINDEKVKFNKYFERRDKKYIYPEQEFEGFRIFTAFLAAYVNVVTFVAPMQWGKTGAILDTAYRMIKPVRKDGGAYCHIHPENVFVITGMSDNEWREQTKDRFPKQWAKNIVHRGNLKKIDERMKTIENALIVIDECHFGTSTGTIVQKKITEWFGLPDAKQLVDRNIRILQTSATPDNIILSAESWSAKSEQVNHVRMTPTTISDSYTGVHTFFREGRIHESVDISEYTNFGVLANAIRHFDTPKFHIFRIATKRGKQAQTIDNINRFSVDNGYELKHHDSDKRIINPEKLLSVQPKKHTIILIKGFWRAAKTLPDDHIGIVHEYKADEKSDTTEAQGLIGRLCGYGCRTGVQGPKVFCSVDSAERYARLVDSGFDYSRDDIEYQSTGVDKKLNQKPHIKKADYMGNNKTYNKNAHIDLKYVIWDTEQEALDWTAENIDPDIGKKKKPSKPSKPARFHTFVKKGTVFNRFNGEVLTRERCDEIMRPKYSVNSNILGRRAFPFYKDITDESSLQYICYYNNYVLKANSRFRY